jgi:hypothetical protein
VNRGAQLTRFFALREASPGLEEEEPGRGELRGARKGPDGREAVHGGGSRGCGRGADGAGGECGASAKEEGHGISIGGEGEGRERGFSSSFILVGFYSFRGEWRAEMVRLEFGPDGCVEQGTCAMRKIYCVHTLYIN